VRFYIPESIPGAEAKGPAADDDPEDEGAEEGESEKAPKPNKASEMEEEEGIKGEYVTLAETLESQIRLNAKLDENMGELICRIEQLNLVVPRGKYTADLYMNNMKLHGNTFNYKILFENVVKAFLLPDNDNIHYSLVLGFNKPLRQGNTKYPYIIFQFKIS
jgi:structure-specific recognition protein 1